MKVEVQLRGKQGSGKSTIVDAIRALGFKVTEERSIDGGMNQAIAVTVTTTEAQLRKISKEIVR